MFIIGKYVEIRFKNWGSPCHFLSCWGQKIKNITKIEHTRLFLFTFFVSFFMAFLEQKLIYAINKWFNFVPVSFFEEDHLLILIFLGVSAKRWPNVQVFQTIIFTYFPIMNNSRKYNEIWSTSFYCIIPS